MADDNQFLSLDSEKGEGLLDWSAFQQWEFARLRDTVSVGGMGDRDRMYDNLRSEATGLYYQLLNKTQEMRNQNRVRLASYFQGESIECIAQTERVSRQAVHKCLQLALDDVGLGVRKARLLWMWGQTIYTSTAISGLS